MFRHLVNEKIETKAFTAVEHAVKAVLESDIVLKEEIEDSLQSAVGCLQIY